MIRNKKKYTQQSEKERGRQLRSLSLKKGIARLEELLSVHDFFSSNKKNQPLPLSLNKQLNLKYKVK